MEDEVHQENNELDEKIPYVHEEKKRIAQGTINRMDEDDMAAGSASYSYQTSYTPRKRGALAGTHGKYRRAKKEEMGFKRDLKYGQYLSVPKGERDIFGDRERARKRKIIILAAGGVLIIAICVLIYCLAFL